MPIFQRKLKITVIFGKKPDLTKVCSWKRIAGIVCCEGWWAIELLVWVYVRMMGGGRGGIVTVSSALLGGTGLEATVATR